jgi:hypothetical protein
VFERAGGLDKEKVEGFQCIVALEYPKMSVWTRTFYDRDCVADALVSAITTKHPLRKQHSLFWAHELWVSEEMDLLYKCLTKAFLTFPPFQGGLDAWKQMKGERSVLVFMGTLLAQVPCATKPCLSPKKDISVLKTAVQKAESQNQTGRLQILLEGLTTKEVTDLLSPEFLKRVDPLLMKAWKQHGQQGRGLGWMLGVPEQPAESSLILEWPKRAVGRLSARTFRTPKRRHPLNPSPFGVFQGCAVWQRILKEVGLNFEESESTGELVFESMEAEMAFYSMYFPDDIPDEWPVSEKEKGHTVS